MVVVGLMGCGTSFTAISEPHGSTEALPFQMEDTSFGAWHDHHQEVAHGVTAQEGVAQELIGAGLVSTNTDGNRKTDSFIDPFEEHTQEEIHDPWESFNTTMFAFNRKVDRYALKPAATAYETVMPDVLERGIHNGFHNFGVVSRLVNNLLQGKFEGAGLEFSRFLINSIVGIGGLMDVAGDYFDMETPDEDFGQTLAVYGTPPGPYLIPPFLPPFTVRDAGAFLVDGAMNPANWLLSFLPTFLAMRGGEMLNERSLNLDRFEGVEETTVDLYGAVRNAYGQKRALAINE